MTHFKEFGVVIVGAGYCHFSHNRRVWHCLTMSCRIGGLGMGMALKRKLGFDDFVVSILTVL